MERWNIIMECIVMGDVGQFSG